MNKQLAVKTLSDLLDAYDMCCSNEHFKEHGDDVCDATILALTALQDENERLKLQDRCVCEKYKNRRITWDGYEEIVEVAGDYTELDIVKNTSDGRYYIRAHGEGIAEMEISFCPLCGRRLR